MVGSSCGWQWEAAVVAVEEAASEGAAGGSLQQSGATLGAGGYNQLAPLWLEAEDVGEGCGP